MGKADVKPAHALEWEVTRRNDGNMLDMVNYLEAAPLQAGLAVYDKHDLHAYALYSVNYERSVVNIAQLIARQSPASGGAGKFLLTHMKSQHYLTGLRIRHPAPDDQLWLHLLLKEAGFKAVKVVKDRYLFVYDPLQHEEQNR